MVCGSRWAIRSTTRRAGGPGTDPQPPLHYLLSAWRSQTCVDLDAEQRLDQVERLVGQELPQPARLGGARSAPGTAGRVRGSAGSARASPAGERSAEETRRPRRWRRRLLRGGITGRQIQQREHDEADRQQGGDGEQQAADRVTQHADARAAVLLHSMRGWGRPLVNIPQRGVPGVVPHAAEGPRPGGDLAAVDQRDQRLRPRSAGRSCAWRSPRAVRWRRSRRANSAATSVVLRVMQ